jgi:hypothetical protein
MRSGVWIAVFLVAGVVTSGCNRLSYTTTDVSGTITISGAPASEGGVTFTPLAAHRGKGVFAPLVNGRYEAKQVAVGPTRVTFRLTKETGRTVEVYGKQAPELESIVPPKYVQGLEVEISPRETTRDFELDGK